MRRRAYLAGVGAAISLAGCTGTLGTGGATCGEKCDVGMSTNAYLPERIETTVGSTVVWKNTSSRAHTVTAYEEALPEGGTFFASGGFDSQSAAESAWKNGLKGGIDPGVTFEHTFETAGTYGYFCIPHERQGMTGTVVVKE